MLRRIGSAIYRGVFWTYERGTWQYDVMVALILCFIFLTPRGWFHDRPGAASAPAASDVVLLQNDKAGKIYRLQAALIDVKSDLTLEQGARRVLRRFTGKTVEITRIEPATDSSGQVISYEVWVRE